MRMIPGRFLLPLLLLPLLAHAGEDEVKEQLKQVYPQGGKTLYCDSTFDSVDSRVKLDFIYDVRRMMDHFSCITRHQCEGKPEFRAASSDLHNVFPVKSGSELDRRRTTFAELPAEVQPNSEQCPYKLSFQTFDPPDSAKGDVARAVVYMHEQHKLPMMGSLTVYQEWNRMDPPDDTERARNDRIEKIQGNRNPYIDDPKKMDALKAPPTRTNLNLQFGP